MRRPYPMLRCTYVARDSPTGISTVNPSDIPFYLAPLLSHALQHIPPSQHSSTPVYLLATAGMRLLPSAQSDAILSATCSLLRSDFPFVVDGPSAAGPCGESIRIISGEEEGMWGWVAVNYLMDGFGHAPDAGSESDTALLPLAPLAEPPPDSGSDSVTPVDPNHHSPTFGFLDMGGASTQLAFSPSVAELDRSGYPESDLRHVSLRLLSGEVVEWPVFVASWLGFGTNRVRERYLESLISAWRGSDVSHDVSTPIEDPCLPIDLIVPSPDPDKHPALRGTGSFTSCLTSLRPLLQHTTPCPTSHCLFAGLPTPHIDFQRSDQRGFIGISEYWYTAQQVLGLGGVWDWAEWEKGMSAFCSRSWDAIDEQVTAEQGWRGAIVERERLQMQCFKGAWISNVLHEGIGIPRLVDAGGGEMLTDEVGGTNAEAARRAREKGLGSKSHFQSMDEVDSTAISWTLGKMVIEASRAVPPSHLSWTDRLSSVTSNHFAAFEDRLTNTIGVSPIWAYAFFAAVLFLLCGITSIRRRLRHRRRAGRSRKPSISGSSPVSADSYTYSLDDDLLTSRKGLSRLISRLTSLFPRTHRSRSPIASRDSLPLVNTLSTPYVPPTTYSQTASPYLSQPPSPSTSSPPRLKRSILAPTHLGVNGSSAGWNDPPLSILNGGDVVPERTLSRQSSRVNLADAAGLERRSASRAGGYAGIGLEVDDVRATP